MDHGADSYRRYLDGDENGFTEIVRDYKDGLILYLNSFTGSLAAAEDLAEDTFVRLGLRKPRFLGKATFKTWLYAAGRNAAIDYLRKNAGRGSVPLEECEELADAQSLESAYLRQERRILLYGALKRLKAEYRQVLWLVYFEGFSQKEAARIMRKGTHATEVLVSRARQALKAELIREGFTDENL